MGYLDQQRVDLGADSQEDGKVSTAVLNRRAATIDTALQRTGDTDQSKRFQLTRELAEIQIELGQGEGAWENAMSGFQWHIDAARWQEAVLDCDTLFRSDQPDALVALGHGLWLSITFPVDPELTVAQLRHVIDETPADSDGAAVAAAMAAYVVELRGNVNGNDDASLVVGQLLNDVSRRHGSVGNSEQFDAWFQRLELGDPAKLAVRMRNIIDVLVQDQWWIDRNALQAQIPAEA